MQPIIIMIVRKSQELKMEPAASRIHSIFFDNSSELSLLGLLRAISLKVKKCLISE